MKTDFALIAAAVEKAIVGFAVAAERWLTEKIAMGVKVQAPLGVQHAMERE